MTVGLDVDRIRREWEDGWVRLRELAADPVERERLDLQVDAVTRELQRRLGGPFTLAELAEVYAGAETWTRDAVAEGAPVPGWPATLTTASDAAFHLYSRGALDYRP